MSIWGEGHRKGRAQGTLGALGWWQEDEALVLALVSALAFQGCVSVTRGLCVPGSGSHWMKHNPSLQEAPSPCRETVYSIVLKLECASEVPGVGVKTDFSVPPSEHLLQEVWGESRICTSNKFPTTTAAHSDHSWRTTGL